jgi:hypothetical protein
MLALRQTAHGAYTVIDQKDPLQHYFDYQFEERDPFNERALESIMQVLGSDLPADGSYVRLPNGVLIPSDILEHDYRHLFRSLQISITRYLEKIDRQMSYMKEGKRIIGGRMAQKEYVLVSEYLLGKKIRREDDRKPDAAQYALWIDSMAYVYSVLRMFPAGVTPQHLSRIYQQEYDRRRAARQRGVTLLSDDFTSVFLGIKLLGLLYREDMKKDSAKHQSEMMTHIYSLRRAFSETNALLVAGRRDFKEIFSAATDTFAEELSENTAMRSAYLLLRSGFNTIEMLQALVDQDFSLLIAKMRSVHGDRAGQNFWNKDPKQAAHQVNRFVSSYDRLLLHE